MQAEILRSAVPTDQLLFDWQIDVSRLEKAAIDAKQNNVTDPWALAEAECSLDLIQAELAAARAGPASDARTRTVAHLDAWRLRIERVIRNLHSMMLRSGSIT